MDPADASPRYRSLLLPAFRTTGVSLVAFGLAHAAFITWAVDRSEDASLPLRLLLMFAAPAGFGILWSLPATLLAAAVWRRAHGTPLAGWRYGPALATAILPATAAVLVMGPFGEDIPGKLSLSVLPFVVVVPALAGWYVSRDLLAGVLLGLSAVSVGLPISLFVLGGGIGGWVGPFFASTVLILCATGIVMERFVRRAGTSARAPPPTTA